MIGTKEGGGKRQGDEDGDDREREKGDSLPRGIATNFPFLMFTTK